MNLYRLDYQHQDGSETPVSSLIGGDFLTRNSTAARERAITRARESLMPVTITRITGAGRMKRTFTAQPDGRFTRAA